VKQDATAAAAWYRRAAAAGEVMAEQRLVVLYREGRGVPKDEAESRRIADQWRVRHCADQERAEAGANACDLLAADRHDPQRVTAGSQAFCLTLAADRAVAVCRAPARQSRDGALSLRSLAHKGQFAESRRETRQPPRAQARQWCSRRDEPARRKRRRRVAAPPVPGAGRRAIRAA
jgi:hypothetical protein